MNHNEYKWERPVLCSLKINIDVLKVKGGGTKLGMVIRDDYGRFLTDTVKKKKDQLGIGVSRSSGSALGYPGRENACLEACAARVGLLNSNSEIEQERGG
ncbi:unnamed protein product [Linum trigynum]|uniref:Uncharacterized protein n=1 Tax=Linum trigynum TaxID=586398 RepID=A0AAV2FYE1_9ROSI